MEPIEPIDPNWVKGYIDQWIEVAGKLPSGPMRDAALLRADHAIDLVKAWKARER